MEEALADNRRLLSLANDHFSWAADQPKLLLADNRRLLSSANDHFL
jgi:hypothetical protein